MSSGVTEVFVDLSPLLDYCLSYADGQEDTEYVLEEIMTKKVVSEITWNQFTQQTSNRAVLFQELFSKISRIQDRLQADEEEIIGYICENVITEDWFSGKSLYGLNESVEVDIEGLRNHLRDVGITEFLEALNEFEQRLPIKEQKIDVLIDDKTISLRSHLMLETYLGQVTGNTFRAENLVQAAFWNRDVKNGLVLIRNGDPAVESRDEINSIIANELSNRDTLNIMSPTDVLGTLGVDPF